MTLEQISAVGGGVATAAPADDAATQVQLRMHPRVFAALGADLVTSDVVAVVELVKNAYDAFAENVWVRLRADGDHSYLEVEDDGCGMTKDIITDVWCLVATPYKEIHPNASRRGATRRVSGAKGLGRLSVGRLGERLTMFTKADGHPCWQVEVDWAEVASSAELDSSVVELRQSSNTLRSTTGTLLRIEILRSEWDERLCGDLKDNLERLVSPFSSTNDFRIFFESTANGASEGPVAIRSQPFLSEPKYRIHGTVDEEGNARACYQYSAMDASGTTRRRDTALPWSRIAHEANSREGRRYDDCPNCGPFSFDIRAWDISSKDTQEIAVRFDLQKSRIRSAIRAHKGIAVYRDGILVLPKSDDARDWLGLDLRRISKVGTRLSTSQLVAYVAITAEGNPEIRDTSDRERLASSQEVFEFQEILRAIVGMLENERDEDRIKHNNEAPMKDLLSEVSAEEAMGAVRRLADTGASAQKVVPVLANLDKSLAAARKGIERRFAYYSRLATVGTIAHMLVHEIRNRTTAIGRFFRLFQAESEQDGRLTRTFRRAIESVKALEHLADVFAPLASRKFKRHGRTVLLEDRIAACLELQANELKNNHVRCSTPNSKTTVAVHPGELDAVIINLITNALYWLSEVPKDQRHLAFSISDGQEENRVAVEVSDSGPGIADKDLERVFWPGVTRKPNGIGMGLTVAAEIVAAYGGRMSTERVEEGARIAFDLPCASQEEDIA